MNSHIHLYPNSLFENQALKSESAKLSSLTEENHQLKLEVGSLENRLNYLESQFKKCVAENFKLNGELVQLRALKKSITQYYTS